jgi:Replicative DNA helicase
MTMVDRYLDYIVVDDFFPKGMLSIIAGRPAIGKTFFVNHLAQTLSQHGERVLYFCLEPFTIEQKERLDQSNFPPNVVDIPAVSIDEVRYLVNQKWRYDAIIIDYVQLMDFVRYIHCFNRNEELKAIWHFLDGLAKEKEMRVIGVSQLVRVRIDRSEDTIPEDCMDYLDRDFLAKRLRIIDRPSYYTNENEISSKMPIHLIMYGGSNKAVFYALEFLE